MKKLRYMTLAVGLLFVVGCASDEKVRDTCSEHDGVRSTNGSQLKMRVTCNDGYFKTIR